MGISSIQYENFVKYNYINSRKLFSRQIIQHFHTCIEKSKALCITPTELISLFSTIFWHTHYRF